MTIDSRKHPARRLSARLSLSLAALVGAGLAGLPAVHAAEPGTGLPAAVATAGVPDFSQITRRYGPTVVNISISGMRQVSVGPDTADMPGGDNEADPMQQFLRRFQQQFGGAGASMQVPVRGLGSGFIVSEDGLILTNAHVIANASDVVVKLTDRREFHARVIGSDRKTDIAVLKIDAQRLPTVSIGDPAELQVGQWVLAIGAPYGFENSVSAGVVSAKGRSLPDGSGVPFIQTDAAINPGNSGGALLSMDGKLLGVQAVIDKDRLSALLAEQLGADTYVILTGVPKVAIDFGKPTQKAIGQAHPDDMEKLGFAAGSMGPKVQAACEFARQTGKTAVIGSLSDIEAIVQGSAGTRISTATPGITYL